jgi:hypothetical protein
VRLEEMELHGVDKLGTGTWSAAMVRSERRVPLDRGRSPDGWKVKDVESRVTVSVGGVGLGEHARGNRNHLCVSEV